MAITTLKEQINNLASSPRPGVPCKVGVILKELDSSDSQSLAEILDKSRTSASVIVRLLMDNGYRVSTGTVGNHRRRVVGSGCTCPKSVAV